MAAKSGRVKRTIKAVFTLAVLGGVAAVIYKGCIWRPPFDANAIAAAETAMWRAYYDSKKPEMVLQLVSLQQNQFGMSFFEAGEVARRLGEAAMRFRSARGNYEAIALPHLRAAYARLAEATGAGFDPEAAARAELSWWVARRTPGRDSAEQVGAEIANLYAILYGEARPGFLKAGRLRAQAAQLRDAGGANASWHEVEMLLRKSYAALSKSL